MVASMFTPMTIHISQLQVRAVHQAQTFKQMASKTKFAALLVLFLTLVALPAMALVDAYTPHESTEHGLHISKKKSILGKFESPSVKPVFLKSFSTVDEERIQRETDYNIYWDP